MDTEKKRLLAAELLGLTRDGIQLEGYSVDESMRDHRQRFQKAQRIALLDLYVKHYSEDQLQAQIDFHTSDMGKSILKARTEFAKEFRELLPSIVKEFGQTELSSEQLRGFLKGAKPSLTIQARKTPPDKDRE